MNCERAQAEFFYLAEDNDEARTELDRHLSGCSHCSREWQYYKAVMEAYGSVELPSPPALRAAEKSPTTWRLVRIAAVLAFGLFLSMLGPETPKKQPQVTTNRDASNLLNWEVPGIEYSYYPVRTGDRDFQEQVNYLRESIAVLQNESSLESF